MTILGQEAPCGRRVQARDGGQAHAVVPDRPGYGRAPGGPHPAGAAPAEAAQIPSSRPPAPRSGGCARVLGLVLVCCGLAMLPWLLVLARSLPAPGSVPHWPTAWIGLDALEAVGLAATGLLLIRRDPRRCLTATATAALLVVDAWFDVTTSAPGPALTAAIAMAAGAELPLAAVCAVVAVRTFAAGTRQATPEIPDRSA